MLPLRRAEKLHTAAEIALDIGPAELRRTVQRSPVEAKKLLRRFPGIGEPSADAAPRCDACPLASACVWCLTHA
jgi:hypothetical protein